MKKLSCLLVIAMAVGLISSCKPKEKCPAYGKYKVKHNRSASA